MNILIERNIGTDGWSCHFAYKDKKYWADLSPVGGLNECMIFEVLFDGSIFTQEELYCKRGLNVTPSSLLACVKEFVSTTK
jgi:hypothetical protein